MKFEHSDELSRKHLSNPWAKKSLDERLVDSKAIDLRDNFRIVDHENGFSSIEPIDETKLWALEKRKEHIEKCFESSNKILAHKCLSCRNHLSRNEFMLYGAWCENKDCQTKRSEAIRKSLQREDETNK